MNAVQSEVCGLLENDLKALKDRLSVQALDGTPFLLCLDTESGIRVYGDWNGQKGFMSAELVPAHLCGTIQMSSESAQKNIAHLAAKGLKAYYQHWRAFAEQRVAALEQTLQAVRAV